jgi:hypothetical protein
MEMEAGRTLEHGFESPRGFAIGWKRDSQGSPREIQLASQRGVSDGWSAGVESAWYVTNGRCVSFGCRTLSRSVTPQGLRYDSARLGPSQMGLPEGL